MKTLIVFTLLLLGSIGFAASPNMNDPQMVAPSENVEKTEASAGAEPYCALCELKRAFNGTLGENARDVVGGNPGDIPPADAVQ